MVETIDTDVLVIGSGIAGCRAAIEAQGQGSSVLLTTKSLFKKGGATVCAYGFTRAPVYAPGDSDQLQFFRWLTTSGLLADQELMKIIIDGSIAGVRDLEELGVRWARNPDGSYIMTGFPGAPPCDIASPQKNGETGKAFIDALGGRVRRLGINILEETIVTKLLTSENQVVGATALRIQSGEFFVIKSKSTVLATGAADACFRTRAGSDDTTGDGYSLAYRAGAELTNMELQSFTMNNMTPPTVPSTWDGTVAMPAGFMLPTQEGPLYLYSDGKPLGKPEDRDRPHVIANEFFEAARLHKAIVADASKIVQTINECTILPEYARKIGFDLRREKAFLTFSAHMNSGGVRINDRCESTLRSLYATGGVSACSGQKLLIDGLVLGKIAGRNAAENAREGLGETRVDEKQVENEERRVFAPLQDARKEQLSSPFSPPRVKLAIQDVMTDKYTVVKNEKSMLEALQALEKIRLEMVPKMRLSSDTRVFNLDWRDYLEVFFMLDASELIVRPSLMRKESRGNFRREDYPNMDNDNWLKNIVIKIKKKEGNDQEASMDLHTVPIEFKYVKPEDMLKAMQNSPS